MNVKQRDNGKCVICGNDGTNAHHVFCEGYFPELSNCVDNGVTLCRTCHMLVHRGKFGTTAKGKYAPEYSINRLQERASAYEVYPLITRLVMADVESVRHAVAVKRNTNVIE